jgi:hypothetical protein
MLQSVIAGISHRFITQQVAHTKLFKISEIKILFRHGRVFWELLKYGIAISFAFQGFGKQSKVTLQ